MNCKKLKEILERLEKIREEYGYKRVRIGNNEVKIWLNLAVCLDCWKYEVGDPEKVKRWVEEHRFGTGHYVIVDIIDEEDSLLQISSIIDFLKWFLENATLRRN